MVTKLVKRLLVAVFWLTLCSTPAFSQVLPFAGGGVTEGGVGGGFDEGGDYTPTGTWDFSGGTLIGNISTATALAANGANCGAGELAAGVSATGAAEGCVNVATQAELDAHIADVTDVHSAAGITVDSTDLDGVETNLQGVLVELQDEINGLAATNIAYVPTDALYADPDPENVHEALEALAARDIILRVIDGPWSSTECNSEREIIVSKNHYGVGIHEAGGCPDGAASEPIPFHASSVGFNRLNGSSGTPFDAPVGGDEITVTANRGFTAPISGSTVTVTPPTPTADRLMCADGSSWAPCNAVGTGLTLSGGTLTATAAISQLHVFTPQQNEPPAANFATLDTRNSHPILVFADAVDSSAVFSGIFNRAYSGGALSVDIHFSMAGGIVANAVGWCAQLEALVAQDIDSDGFHAVGAGLCVSASVSGTDGGLAIGTVALSTSEIDSIAAGGAFRLKIMRDGDGTNITDSAAGSAQLRMVEIRQ